MDINTDDILAAITGIANARLLDGIADGNGDMHKVSVVLWRNHGDDTSVVVITHVDELSVVPFFGETVTVYSSERDDLSAIANAVVKCAERRASDELDRNEEAEQIASTFGKERVELVAQIPATVAGHVLADKIRNIDLARVHSGTSYDAEPEVGYVGEFATDCGARWHRTIKVTDDTDDVTCPACIYELDLDGAARHHETTADNR